MRLRTRQFPAVQDDKGDETTLEDFVPSHEQDPADAVEEREFYKKYAPRLPAVLEEYKRRRNARTRAILDAFLTEESYRSIARRLSCTPQYVRSVKTRFIKEARAKVQDERAPEDSTHNKFKGDSMDGVKDAASRERIRKARIFSQVVLSVEKDGAGTPGDLAERLGIARSEAKEAIRAAMRYGLIRTIRKEYGDLCVIWR